MTGATGTSRLPTGWLATLIGGVVGGLLGGFLGLMAGIAYADRNGTGGLEDLVYPLYATPVGAWFGAALGAAALLRVFHRSSPTASGFLFAAIDVVAMVVLFAIGEIFTPQEFNETIGVVAITVMPPVVAAIVARWLLTRQQSWDEPPVQVP